MKTMFLRLLLPLLCLGPLAFAQEGIRNNYLRNGYTHIRAERVPVSAGSSDRHPFQLSLEYVGLPGGQSVWLLYMDFEDKSSWTIPKNAALSLRTADGKVVGLKNMGSGNGEKIAFTSGGQRLYWNQGKYALEEADLKKLLSGVRQMDVTTSWDVDGYFQSSFAHNEFSAALQKQYDLIRKSPRPDAEMTETVAGVSDLSGNRTIVSRRLQVISDPVVKLWLSYLYFRATNHEHYDLNIEITDGLKGDIPEGTPIEFRLVSGETIVLRQEKTRGTVLCYPTPDQLKKLFGTPSKFTVKLEDHPVLVDLMGSDFHKVLRAAYNGIQIHSIL